MKIMSITFQPYGWENLRGNIKFEGIKSMSTGNVEWMYKFLGWEKDGKRARRSR